MSDARATREAYGETLIELANAGRDDIVALDADLSGSTTTGLFAKAFPERFFNTGVAEQNMIGTAAGLAQAGKTAFTGSFAVFATGRAYDQIRNTVCYSNLDVKICPTHAGITVGPDGGSHQMLEDLALMRALPNMRVLVPADYWAAKAAIRLAAETSGPFYVRLGRAKVPLVYEEGFALEPGRAYVLREGEDVTLAACGVMVAEALEAAEELARRDVSAEVVDVASLKPLDEETLTGSLRKTRHVVTCEEHTVMGGLGSAVAELSAEGALASLVRVGIQDVFGTSGDPDDLMEHYGLTAGDIARAAEGLLASSD
jgi:transketolase